MNTYYQWRNGILGDIFMAFMIYTFRRIIVAFILGGLIWFGYQELLNNGGSTAPWDTIATVKLVSPMVVIWLFLTWVKF